MNEKPTLEERRRSASARSTGGATAQEKRRRPASRDLGKGRQTRVWIENVEPEVDCGRWPAKGVAGTEFTVEADLVCDGHDIVAGALLYRRLGRRDWSRTALEALGNDRYRGSFELSGLGRWQYAVEGWVDEFATWRAALAKKVAAGMAVELELSSGADLLAAASRRARATDAAALRTSAAALADPTAGDRISIALDEEVAALASRYPDRTQAARHPTTLEVRAERAVAACSAWYEVFARSTGPEGRHGTFADLENLLPYVASMGFDVLYLPPIHPIGHTHRKGRNNALAATPEDPGSPWAIGSEAGGHKAVHPQLGDAADLERLIRAAAAEGLEVALDVAFQASPDHPYVREHPSWFRHRSDGSIQYAENPPKKYQDIYPFDFASEDWPALWAELESVFEYWIERGVRIFRVDNPHTKPLEFWAWCLGRIQDRHPDTVFLAEAFTRPKLMYALAKAGFSQSYTYFTWRNTAAEMRDYLEEIVRPPVSHFFRPCFWPNTPDILPEHLQTGGRAAFVVRFVLAATLASNYGIYGPAFELGEHVAREGVEEYVDNEKYELRRWNLDDPQSLRPLITAVNRLRRDEAALRTNDGLRFHATDNDDLLCYSKRSTDGSSVILVVANMDFAAAKWGWTDLDMTALGLDWDADFEVRDLVGGQTYRWKGQRNFVRLDPDTLPVHLFVVSPTGRNEEKGIAA